MTVWPTVPFSGALVDQSGGNVKTLQSEYREAGRFPIVDQGKDLVGGYTDDPTSVCRSQPPVLVFGDHTRALKYVDFPFGMGADGVKVLHVRDGFDPKFVFHYLRSLDIPSAGYSRHFKFLKERSVPRPPIEEQRGIAAILDQADALRAKRRESLAHLDDLTQSIFVDMFGRRRDMPLHPFAESVLDFRYGTSNKSQAEGYPALRIPNVVGGTVDTSELKLVPVTDAEFNRLHLVDGDVLFVRTNGNPDNVGRCAVFTRSAVTGSGQSPDHFIYASYLIRARLDVTQTNPVFVREFLLGAAGRKQLRERSRTSAGQYNINITGIGSVEFPRIAMSDQDEFASSVAGIEKARRVQRMHLEQLDTLFASLQSRAFAGQL